MPADISSPLPGIQVCAFDAYGTLFDVNSAAGRLRAELGDKVDHLSAIWRTKQLEYSWLHGWDCAGAASFGFQVVWLNRADRTPERLPAKPAIEIRDPQAPPGLLGSTP